MYRIQMDFEDIENRMCGFFQKLVNIEVVDFKQNCDFKLRNVRVRMYV